jgi:hypothetical protein
MANLKDHMYAADPRNGGGLRGNGVATVTCVSNWGTDNLGINDQHKLFTAAGDCIVSNFRLKADAMDTHATPTLTLDVGTDSDDDEFIAASTVGQAGGTEVTNTASTGTATEAGFPIADGAEIIISCKAAAATAVAGSTTVVFDVIWL